MKCPKCKSTDVTVQVVTDSARTRKRGCLWGLGRMFMIICTLGLWAVIGRTKAKTNMQNHKEAICQHCGHSWRV